MAKKVTIPEAAAAWLERNPDVKRRLERGDQVAHAHMHAHGKIRTDGVGKADRLFALRSDAGLGEQLHHHPMDGAAHFHSHKQGLKDWDNTHYPAHTNGGITNGHIVLVD